VTVRPWGVRALTCFCTVYLEVCSRTYRVEMYCIVWVSQFHLDLLGILVVYVVAVVLGIVVSGSMIPH
jgi:hypothetical protein